MTSGVNITGSSGQPGANLFFDLCKVTYTVLVVGLLVTLFQNELYTNYLMIALVVVGVLVAFEFAKIGNNILKR